MDKMIAAGAVVAFAALAIALWAWHFSRSRQILQSWAARSGLELLQAERRLFFRGPFWWRTGKGQEVFRIVVRDAAGQQRSGHARIGGWFLGMLSDHVEVRWDD